MKMSYTYWILAVWFVFTFNLTFASEVEEGLFYKKKDVSFEELPQDIKEYLAKKYPDAVVEKQKLVESLFYEIKLIKQQKKFEIKVAPNAQVLNICENIFIDQVSPLALESLHKTYPRAILREIEKIFSHGETVYEVDLSLANKELELCLDNNGVILASFMFDEKEKRILVNELPLKVKNSIAKSFVKYEIKKVEFESQEGKKTYEVVLVSPEKAGKMDVKYTGNGDLLEKEEILPLEKLPQAIQIFLQEKYPNAKIKKQEMVQEFTYEIIIKSERETLEIRIDAGGNIVSPIK